MPIIFIVSQPKRSDDRIGWSHQKNGQGKIDPETIGLPPGCFIFIPIGVHDYLNMLYTHRYMYLYIHIPVKVESTTRNFLGISPRHNPLDSGDIFASQLARLRVWRVHPPSCKEWPTRTCRWIRYGFVVDFDKIPSKSQKCPAISWTNNWKPPKPTTSFWLRIQ